MKFRSVQDQPNPTKPADLPSTNPDSNRPIGLAINNSFGMSSPMKSVQVIGEQGRNPKDLTSPIFRHFSVSFPSPIIDFN